EKRGFALVGATRYIPLANSGTNRMVASRLQLPPPSFGAGATTITGPADASMVFSIPSAKKPRARLSGDQNGSLAPSVPASGWAASESRERTQSFAVPASPIAQKATACPSGASAGDPLFAPKKTNHELSGGAISEILACAASRAGRQYEMKVKVTADRRAPPTAPYSSPRSRPFAAAGLPAAARASSPSTIHRS